MQVATVKLTGPDYKKLDDVCAQIKDICKRTGAKVSGPIPLPTKKLKIPTRRSPCGDGSETFEQWEMRIHKRLLNIETDERTLRQVMRVQVPDQVSIEIELKE
ncbi:MAG: 30S ribosomal protein S10 [Candidatus Diapherotrites archaeon]|nr:30S ribosomal protein S10 [Candidatus Diapherotrites archaeon]